MKPNNVTKTEIDKGKVGNKRGWCFAVYFDNRPYPNLISALYKTKREIQEQLNRYLTTGDFSFYGTAE